MEALISLMPPTKRAALAALHASRRGRPVHPEPPPELAQLAQLVAEASQLASLKRNPLSCRKVAALLGVTDRTARRWLSGEDRPARGQHTAIRRATRQAISAVAALRAQHRK